MNRPRSGEAGCVLEPRQPIYNGGRYTRISVLKINIVQQLAAQKSVSSPLNDQVR